MVEEEISLAQTCLPVTDWLFLITNGCAAVPYGCKAAIAEQARLTVRLAGILPSAYLLSSIR
jgi:hypothetical protein